MKRKKLNKIKRKQSKFFIQYIFGVFLINANNEEIETNVILNQFHGDSLIYIHGMIRCY